ncbi:GntR family transcriptional regulator [Agromyces sp. SYSU K20354]|uniref:GntR family transcriptional regulator n=1 Tax=Agromyces cavernae TaxID=2898659 RepID=UPI001E545B13|nr:GntR family transcriptional regulator [Agromyces cavernae]MCD2441826.1 GntR family transcriptional regulator [Agromyces cavernae]
MVSIDLSGASPPSDQIYQQLRGQILTGRLAPGDRLPTVRQLARDLGLAVGTVARAYKQLEADAFVQTRARAGTVVSPSPRSLPADVLKAARELHEAAIRNGLGREETIGALTGMWPE